MENQTTNNERISAFLQGVVEKLNVDARVEQHETADGVYYKIVGKDAHKVIGYRGEALDALQCMASLLVDEEEAKRIYVDAENYREKRKDVLTKLAHRLAIKAHKTKKRQALEPMNPYERRVIHCALQNSDIAETISEGEGKDRHIVVVPKNESAQDRVLEETPIAYGKSNFAQKGFAKTRSFGGKKRRF